MVSWSVRLLDPLSGSPSSLTADGAYDQDGVYAVVAERHPGAAVIATAPHGGAE
jgi:hypothetical protein